ncbi:prolyl oligopeptidase family serine peptidase [Sphingobium sp. H39-3-25]|nr:prolyl oligopeptidase family serine peptidase [Sphingobium arseniciresistens]
MPLLPGLLLPSLANAREDASMHEDDMHVEQPEDIFQVRRGPAAQISALNAGSTIGDILNHPSFAGFASRILPWDGRIHDVSLPLRDIGSLLPYHSHVELAVVLGGLNRMIADVALGRSVFYDIYSEAEKQAEPARQHTGLFFFRGRPGAPFAVIAPGGGFDYVGSVHEGLPYAQEISRQGYNAFVLKYRAGRGGRIATQDLAAALSFIFRNAKALQVETEGYSLWGSSAGARMAASIGSHGVAAFGGDVLPKPSTVVTAYTAHSDTSADEPATFAVVGEQDRIAPPSSMQSRIAVLRRGGTPAQLHRYTNVGHGFGTGAGTSAHGWINNAVRFWEKQMHGRTKQKEIP